MDDETLRNRRLVTYEEEINELSKLMQELMTKSESDTILLIDKAGHMVCLCGKTENLRRDNLAALVAGSFASMKAIANELGETHFTSFFQQGDTQNLFVTLVGGRSLLTVVFSESAKLGMVKLFSGAIREKMEEIQKKYDKQSEKMEINTPSGLEVGSKLDSLFGL